MGVGFTPKGGYDAIFKPLVERLIESKRLLRVFLKEFEDHRSYLEIKPSVEWDTEEVDRHYPKTYRETVLNILSLCLIQELCNIGLNHSKTKEADLLVV